MTSQRSNRSMTSLQRAKVKVARAQLKLKYLEQDAQVQAQQAQVQAQQLQQQVQTQLLMNKLKTEQELEESKILISVLTEDDSKVHANSTLVKTELSAIMLMLMSHFRMLTFLYQQVTLLYLFQLNVLTIHLTTVLKQLTMILCEIYL